jgi:agmatinase
MAASRAGSGEHMSAGIRKDTWSMPPFRTFLSAPMCELSAEAIEQSGAGAVFFGAPVDSQGFPDRPGAILGPDACRRESLVDMGATTVEFRIDLHDFWHIVDCGNVSIAGGNLAHHHEAIYDATTAILRGGAIPMMLGGDHSIPIPGVRALADHIEGPVGYLHIDAHVDTADEINGERNTMVSPARRTLDNPNIDPKNVVLFGIRGAANNPDVIDMAYDLGMNVITMFEIIDMGIDAAIQKALDLVHDGTEGLYVTFDNDSMDSGLVPGTTAPEVNGLTSREMTKLAVEIGRRGFSMLDVAELSPLYDSSNITARLDVYWLVYCLSGYADALNKGTARLLPKRRG